jgi:hypothetical protein
LQVELVETIFGAGSQFSSDKILPTAEDAVNSSDPNGAKRLKATPILMAD